MGVEMKKLRNDRRHRGVTLAEVLVTLALLSVVLLALIPMFMLGVKVNASSNQLTQANTLAREKLDELLMYPTTDPRLYIPAGSNIAMFGNDLPAYYKPDTGETSKAATSPGPGWFPYPCVRTYTVQAVTNAGLVAWSADTTQPLPALTNNDPATATDESKYNDPTVAAHYYELKIVTVTVRPSGGPFVGLRTTVQTAYVRFRHV